MFGYPDETLSLVFDILLQHYSAMGKNAFALTLLTAMQIYWKKERVYTRKAFNSHRIGFGKLTWPAFQCFETPQSTVMKPNKVLCCMFFLTFLTLTVH